jgi:predicted DNA-binding transcriptional regulator AlpA
LKSRYIPEEAEIVYTKQMLSLLGGIHESTLWRWLKDGYAPEPITLPNGRKAWLLAEVRAWLESLREGRK